MKTGKRCFDKIGGRTKIVIKKKIKQKYILAFCYLMSLLPIFLPWCYFDEEIDGIKYGTDIVNYVVMIVLAAVTFFCIVFYTNQKGIMITGILLFIHPVMYFVCGLSWYVPLLADFNLLLSLEVVHYGFYLSLLCSSLMCWFYVKKGRKDMENNRLKRRKDKMAI